MNGRTTRTLYHEVDWETNPFDSSQLIDTRGTRLYLAGDPDTDGDGLKDAEEALLGTDPNEADTDGDALPDGWEVDGHDFIDLAALGADPLHKDVFVECDYMGVQKPTDAAIAEAVEAFAGANVNNPDGVDGVNLHVDIGGLVPDDTDLNPVWTEFDAIKSANFSSDREDVYHYCIFAFGYDGGNSSGKSRGIDSADFVVTLGDFGDVEGWQTGTFMHELGHNLGLEHGGIDSVNYKPNYLSVMNYSFQFDGLMKDGVEGTYDYSRFNLHSLDELALSEAAGLNRTLGEQLLSRYGTLYADASAGFQWDQTAASNVDWNDNGAVAGVVAADVNDDGLQTTLDSWNDWHNLSFDGGGTLGSGASLRFARIVAPHEDIDCLPVP